MVKHIKLSIILLLYILFLSCTKNNRYRYIEYGIITNIVHKENFYKITVKNVSITVHEDNVTKIGNSSKLKLYRLSVRPKNQENYNYVFQSNEKETWMPIERNVKTSIFSVLTEYKIN